MSEFIVEALKMIAKDTVIMGGGIGAFAGLIYGKNKIEGIQVSKNCFKQSIIDRTKHRWVIGMTGVGKSTLCENLAYDDISTGEIGVVFVDIHGDSSAKLIGCIPESERDNVIYLNPYDYSKPIGFNPLRLREKTATEKATVCELLLGTFERLYSNYWGVSTEDLIKMAIMAVLDRPEESTIWDVYKMLTDEMYRDIVTASIKDPLVRSFWSKDFKKVSSNNLNAPLNKLRGVLANPFVRNCICQTGDSVLDLNEVMETKHLIVNLDQRKLTTPASELLAGFIATSLQMATKQRERGARFVGMYYDEFQNYCNPAFEEYLSECRKFNVGLTLSHQYISQLPESIQKAIKGNVGTKIAFAVGEDDAPLVSKFMKLTKENKPVEDLPDYHCYIKRKNKGRFAKPLYVGTPLPLVYDKEVAKIVRDHSRNTWGGKPFSIKEARETHIEEQKVVLVGNASTLVEDNSSNKVNLQFTDQYGNKYDHEASAEEIHERQFGKPTECNFTDKYGNKYDHEPTDDEVMERQFGERKKKEELVANEEPAQLERRPMASTLSEDDDI